MIKNNSPYTASITGGGFLFDETNALLPLFLSEDRVNLLKDEALNNKILKINSETGRKRTIAELTRRFDAVPLSFWKDYLEMAEDDKRIANFYLILKTYKIVFDFHINVTMNRWNSISKSVTNEDLYMEMNEISANDEFVDSWADATKKKVVSAYLTILKKVGMLDNNRELHPLSCTNFDYYLKQGESWFLEACLLQPYEIENIKKSPL